MARRRRLLVRMIVCLFVDYPTPPIWAKRGGEQWLLHHDGTVELWEFQRQPILEQTRLLCRP